MRVFFLVIIFMLGCSEQPFSPRTEFKREFGFDLPANVGNLKFKMVRVYPDYIDCFTALWRFECDRSTAESIFQKCSMHLDSKYAVIPFRNLPGDWPAWWMPPPVDEAVIRYYVDYDEHGYAHGAWINGVAYIEFVSVGSHLKNGK